MLFLFGGVVLWSTAEVVTRAIIGQITPIQLAAMRFTLGGGILLIALPFELRRKSLKLTPDILLKAAAIGFVGIAVGNLCFQYGLRYVGAGIMATMFGASPMMVLLLSHFMLNNPMTRPKAIGVALGFLGVLALAVSQPSQVFSFIGFVLAFSTSACFALFTVLVKRFAGPYAGLPFTSLCILAGALYIVPVMLLEGETSSLEHLRTLSVPVLYLGCGATGIAYLLYFLGLESVDATQANSSIFLKPPLATLLAAIFLHEPITWNLAVALVLILLGLYLIVFVDLRRARGMRAVS